MLKIFLLLLAFPCFAAITNVQVQGVTSTQAIVAYTAPSDSACTVVVSRAPGLSPVVEDVNGTLYPGANSDNRTGNIVSGRSRVIIIGRRGVMTGFSAIDRAADGHRRSRALMASTKHYGQITCGVDTATFEFTTANIETGDTRGEPLPVSYDKLWEYEGVTANPAVYPEYADPLTGVRMVRSTAHYSFGYGASSSTWPDGSAPSDCNKTLAGVVSGACLFTEATGTNWTFTTTSLTAAIRGDDSNYAEYSGTAREPLFMQLSPAIHPSTSTAENLGGMACQNTTLKLKTSDASGEGGQVEICLTVNGPQGECSSPWLRYTLTNTTETSVRFCKDVPCSTPDANGDIMFENSPPFYVMGKNVRAYNTAGDLATINFVGSGAAAFCDNLRTNEYLVMMDASLGNAPRWSLISAKSCGSSPPNVTTNSVSNFYMNGTAGVGVYTISAWPLNPRYGVLVRKASTTSSATISVNYALHRYGFNPPFTLNLGSAGFGKRCQVVPLANGEYLCHFSQFIVGVSFAADGSMNMTNYGFAYLRGDFLSGNLVAYGSNSCLGTAATNDSMWSDTEPGVFFCYLRSTYANPWLGGSVDNRGVIVKITLDTSAGKAAGDPDAAGLPGLSNKAQRITWTASEIKTPCSAPCTATSDDHTPYGQQRRYTSDAWSTSAGQSFANCGIHSVQGNKVLVMCFAGAQDSPGWAFAYDMSIAAGTDQIIGGWMVPANPVCRWCATHTYQAPTAYPAVSFTVLEQGTKSPAQFTVNTALTACGTSCDPCPNVTLDEFNYSGRTWCSTISLDSAWSGSWTPSTPPASFEAGDPLYPNGVEGSSGVGFRTWGGKLLPGDFIYNGTEIGRVIQRNSSAQLIIIRGWGYHCTNCSSSSSYAPTSHSSGATWYTYCGAINKNPLSSNPEAVAAVAWWFTQDANATNSDYTYLDYYQNHGGHGASAIAGGIAYAPEFSIARFDQTSAASLKAPTTTVLRLPTYFAGKSSAEVISDGTPGPGCPGNSCEKHPAFGAVRGDVNAQSFFIDSHPRLFHLGTGNSAYSLVAGKTYIRVWNGLRKLYPKHYGIESYTGPWPFRRVDSLTDSASDSGKFCWSYIADACFSGSLAGYIYDVFEEVDNRFISGGSGANNCRESEFGTVQNDRCNGNTAGINSAIAQWRLPVAGQPFLNGAAQRVLTRIGTARYTATDNVKTDPTGRTVLTRGTVYMLPPPFPGVSSASGASFAGIPIAINGVPTGTANVYIEFGYTPSFYCTENRDAVCIAESATLNESVPYQLSGETITGVSCASSCVVTIPAIRNRVVYYRRVYRNGGGTIIHVTPTQVISTV